MATAMHQHWSRAGECAGRRHGLPDLPCSPGSRNHTATLQHAPPVPSQPHAAATSIFLRTYNTLHYAWMSAREATLEAALQAAQAQGGVEAQSAPPMNVSGWALPSGLREEDAQGVMRGLWAAMYAPNQVGRASGWSCRGERRM